MACSEDFVQYIVEQSAGAGEITARKMMGDYCLYCNGVVVGLICDNSLFIKPTEPVKQMLREVVMRPPYDGAKEYFFITDIDNRDYLAEIVKMTFINLPAQKKQKEITLNYRLYETLHYLPYDCLGRWSHRLRYDRAD